MILRIRFHALLLAATLLPSLAAAARDAGPYVDAPAYIQSDEQLDAWFDLVRGLERGFDQICGDTFCEGEYSNIQSLRFRCSVHETSGRIGTCLWVFAASNEEIHPATGRIGVQRAFRRCLTPLVPGTTLEQLLGALAVKEPLYAPLPHSQRSAMDGLVDCL